jgi:hypothetical protein
MKRAVFFVGLVLLVFTASIWAQTQAQAPKPDPELKKLGILVGHWTYEGHYNTTSLGPGGKASGDEFFQWILGGFFLQDLEIEKGAQGETRTASLCAYDSVNKNIVSSGLGSDGSQASGIMKVSGNTITVEAKMVIGGKETLMKAVMTVAPDLMSMTAKVEISMDAKAWVPFGDFQFTKVKPTPKTK